MNQRRDDHPRELLSAYLDGEVDQDVRSSIERHLSICDSCRALLGDFRSVAAAAARETPPPVPGDLRLRVRRALDAQSTPRPTGFAGWLGPYRLGLAAAAAVVLVIGLWAVRQGPPAPDGFPQSTSTVPDAAGEPDRAETPAGSAQSPEMPREPARPIEPRKMLRSGGDDSLKRNGPLPPPVAHENDSVAVPGPQEAQPAAPGGTAPSKEGYAPFASTSDGAGERAGGSRDRAGPKAATAPPGPAAARQEATTPDAGLMESKILGEVAGALSLDQEAGSGRRLLIEYPVYSVSVFEDGTIALSAKEYSCAARHAGAPVDPDVVALFTLASSGKGEATDARRQGSAGAPAVRLIAPSASRAGAGAAAEPVVPATQAREIQVRLKTLLRDRYLPLMEARCGPAPESVRTP